MVFLIYQGSAQTKTIDSLKQILKTLNDDTNKVNKLNNLSNEFNLNELKDSSFAYANKAKALAEKLGFKKGIAKSYMHIGLFYQKQGNSPAAIKNYFEGAKIWEEIGGMGRHALSSYANIGGIYQSLGNYEEALKNWTIALRIARETNDKWSIVNSLRFIGGIYFDQDNFPEALKYFNTRLKLAQEISDTLSVADSYISIGMVYRGLGDFNKAIENHNTAHKLMVEIHDKRGISGSLGQLGDDYNGQGNLPGALKNYYAALNNMQANNDEFGAALCYDKIIKVLIKQKKYKEAEEIGNKTLMLSKKLEELYLISSLNESLSEIYVNLGNTRKAVDCYKAFIVARDSMNDEETVRKTATLATNFEFEKKEIATKLIQEQKDLKANDERKKQQIIFWSVCCILVLTVSFAIFAFRSYKQKQKANEELSEKNITIAKQKHEVDEKQKEILDSIRYAKRIQTSLLPTDKYINRILTEKDKNTTPNKS